jgi:hypothetical protein
MTEKEAHQWPDLYQIVHQKVKPYRDGLKRDAYRTRWWQFGEKQTALYSAIKDLSRVLVVSRVGQQAAFVFLDTGRVYADSLVVICMDSFAAFCVMQSRVHEVWARFFASSMKDDLRYTPSDCLETFPFPKDFQSIQSLSNAGQSYYQRRAEIMAANGEGLTKTYNRFHQPDEDNEDICMLRTLHAAMDRAVLEVYGWTDIQIQYEFIPRFEDESDDDGNSERIQRFRYRWPDKTHDEVLARLLDLNRQRALEEGQFVEEDKTRSLISELRPNKTGGNKPSKHSKSKQGSASTLFAADPEKR